MAVDESKITAFLGGTDESKIKDFLNSVEDKPAVDNSKVDAFLSGAEQKPDIGRNVIDPEDPMSFLDRIAETDKPATDDVKRQLEDYQKSQEDKSVVDYGVEIAGTFNSQFADLLGLPGDITNAVSEGLGFDKIAAGSEDFRRMGANLGITNIEDPDTPAAKVGEFGALSLQFLTPFIKTAQTALKAGTLSTATTSTTKNVVKKIGEPFMLTPKTAIALEIAASGASGVGAFYGGQEFGPNGELIGGLAAGLPVYSAQTLYNVSKQYLTKTLFPYTSQGGFIKAGNVVKSQAETGNVVENIETSAKTVLPDSGLSPAKLSGDKHLIALEKEVLEGNPELMHDFALQEAKTNELARIELEKLGSDVPIERTQAYLKGRVERLTALLDVKVEKSLADAAESLAKIETPAMSRSAANVVVRKKIQSALDSARDAEKEVWSKVDNRIIVPVSNARATHEEYLRGRAKTADKDEMPSYVEEFLGRIDKKGKYKKGSLGDSESVQDIHGLYSRLGKDIREVSAQEAPDWNKVRVMGELRDSVLDDIDVGETSIRTAIEFSREMNKRFSGGALDIIMGSKKTGPRVSPELTLESSIGVGPKGADSIKKVLEAAPESKGEIETYLKSVIGNSSFINTKGQVNIPMAEKFMRTSEEILNIFPELKAQLKSSIEMAKKSKIISTSAEKRKGQISASTANEVAKLKPGTVVGHVLKMPNPETEMAKIYKQADSEGRSAIKGNIIEFLFERSKTGQVGETRERIISGQKLLEAWEKNKKIFSPAFNKEESQRIEKIINTLKLNEPQKGLPSVEGALDPTPNKFLNFVIGTVAARTGAKLGAGTSGASLRTASKTSQVAQDLINKFDVGMAKKILTDAVSDEELFKSLMANTDTAPEFNKAYRVIQGWMIANILQEENE